MIKIILFELTRLLLGYASDKVGEFIRNKQRSGLVLLPFTKKKRKIPGLNIHLADSMILAQLLQAIYNLIARR